MAPKFDANKAQNAVEIEKQFAVKAVEHAQAYWKLLEKAPPRTLKLSKIDDEIFERTMKEFPELAAEPYEKLRKLDEDWMKSADGKKRWRKFIEAYEGKVADHNFGALIRMNSEEEYSESNTIFVMRMQFFAFEIARNRLGLNDHVYEMSKADAAKEAARKGKGGA